ncbi:MAG: hypothetical protein L6R40_004523 [Gallowayella cf. fulva]|nr:MAG: hypothetical protein L6R40_004523 [Xanthomendoza cf. fulva]
MSYLALVGLCLLALPLLPTVLTFFTRSSQVRPDTNDVLPSLDNLNDDVLLEICAAVKQSSNAVERQERFYANQNSQSLLLQGPLKALSSTNKHMRHLAAPKIFQGISIIIGPDGDWANALRALESVARCEAVQFYAKRFMIDLYNHHTWDSRMPYRSYRTGRPPPPRFARKVLEVLARLSKLE